MSIKFTAFEKTTGRVVFSGTAFNPAVVESDIQGVLAGVIYNGGWLDGEVHHEQPLQPSSAHIFDWTTKQWYDPRTIVEVKDAAVISINQAWDSATISGFTHEGKTFSTTQSSRSDIDGINGYVSLYNDFPLGWVGAWKAKDNSYLTIATVQEWKSFYAAMVNAGLANFAKAQALKAQLAAATTKEEVEAITW